MTRAADVLAATPLDAAAQALVEARTATRSAVGHDWGVDVDPALLVARGWTPQVYPWLVAWGRFAARVGAPVAWERTQWPGTHYFGGLMFAADEGLRNERLATLAEEQAARRLIATAEAATTRPETGHATTPLPWLPLLAVLQDMNQATGLAYAVASWRGDPPTQTQAAGRYPHVAPWALMLRLTRAETRAAGEASIEGDKAGRNDLARLVIFATIAGLAPTETAAAYRAGTLHADALAALAALRWRANLTLPPPIPPGH